MKYHVAKGVWQDSPQQIINEAIPLRFEFEFEWELCTAYKKYDTKKVNKKVQEKKTQEM